MKQFEIREFGIENLALAEVDTPRPEYGQVLVRMRAASLNYRDYMVAKGDYNPKMKRPMVPLSDGAGVVEEVGAGVTQFKKGDRVAGCFFQNWIDGPPSREKLAASALGGGIDGVLREFAVFSQHGLVPAPTTLSDEETATLPCAALTAWHALFEDKPLIPGETVLIQGTGGVSTFALQFAVSAGLRAIVISSSDEKLARARQLGAAETINYKSTPDWEEIARKLTGEGVDRVIEVGGSDTLPRSLKSVRMAGSVSVIGVLSGVENTLGPRPILMNSVHIQGIYVGSRAMFQRMNRAVELHRIKPVIDKTFEWTEIKDALQYMGTQQHFGKICLRWS